MFPTPPPPSDLRVNCSCHFEEKLDLTRHDQHEPLLTTKEASSLILRKSDLGRYVKINRFGPIAI